MSYWLSPRTWLGKIIGWATAIVFLAFFPLGVVVSFVYNHIRSNPWKASRVVKDNVVIVTGASSGIGQCLALEYAKRGAKLVLAARREEKLKEVAQKCKENGARDAAICPTDVSKPEQCENLINFTLETFGRVDVLVNNAGSAEISAFEDYPSAEGFRKSVIKRRKIMRSFDIVCNKQDSPAVGAEEKKRRESGCKLVVPELESDDVDFWGNILTTKYALEHLRRTRGQVVVTCSVGAFVPYPKQSFYNASKAALLNFYDTLRTEPIGQKIAITVVMPGFVKSEMTTKGPKGHIPRWWPMMETEDCAKMIVEAAMADRRSAVIPFWYTFNLVFRVFAPELLDWPPRMFLLGQPPTKEVKSVFDMLLGEETTKKAFQSLTAFT